ncbi:hypothetical protein MRX96_017492 [Rhipicephalus microplus]
MRERGRSQVRCHVSETALCGETYADSWHLATKTRPSQSSHVTWLRHGASSSTLCGNSEHYCRFNELTSVANMSVIVGTVPELSF